MRAFKYLCSLLSLVGIIHFEWLAWQAIMFCFSWCGMPQLHRKIVADIYFLLAPFVCVCLAMAWKKTELPDRMVRILGFSFLGAMAIYCFFEYSRWDFSIVYW